jgi:hypothetical protein
MNVAYIYFSDHYGYVKVGENQRFSVLSIYDVWIIDLDGVYTSFGSYDNALQLAVL